MQHAWEFIIILHVNAIICEGRNVTSGRFRDAVLSFTAYLHALLAYACSWVLMTQCVSVEDGLMNIYE